LYSKEEGAGREPVGGGKTVRNVMHSHYLYKEEGAGREPVGGEDGDYGESRTCT